MAFIQLLNVKGQPQVKVRNADRALFYVGYLEFTANAMIELSAEEKIQRAVLDVELLSSLADILDSYLLPLLIAEINTYDIYEMTAQEAYEGVLKEKPGDLLKQYPLVETMFRRVTKNFNDNIALACKRILVDWDTLTAYFFPGRKILWLSKIASSGSDFHKGGKQVLFLTFDAVSLKQKKEEQKEDIKSISIDVPKHDISILDKLETEPLKVVYKPADLERDFRVVCSWAALSEVYGSLPSSAAKSDLKAIFNTSTDHGSLFDLLRKVTKVELPSYKILPRNPGTFIKDSEIGESYGYVEFLPPLCAPPIDIEKYFVQMGVFAAAAYLLGFTDVHHDNIVVRPDGPYPIDLEMAFIGVMQRWQETSITYIESFSREDGYEIDAGQFPAKLALIQGGRPAVSAMAERSMDHVSIIAEVAKPNLKKGFEIAFAAIGKGAKVILEWLKTTEKTVVRLIPLGTESLLESLRSLHDASSKGYTSDEEEIRKRCMEGDWIAAKTKVGGAAQLVQWCENAKNVLDNFEQRVKELGEITVGSYLSKTTLDKTLIRRILRITTARDLAPWFCVWRTGVIADDFLRGDVPSYYCRFDSVNVLDSTGKVVDVSPAKEGDKFLVDLGKVLEIENYGSTFFPFSLYQMIAAHIDSLKNSAYASYFARGAPKG